MALSILMVMWKWMNGAVPDCLYNNVVQYNVLSFLQKVFTWIKSSWLVLYGKDQQKVLQGLIQLMTIQQSKGSKILLMLDYCEQNDYYVTAFTDESDVC